MDPKQRLTMEELRTSEWLQGNKQVVSTTPLVTPDVLSLNPSVASSISKTFTAFHMAHREGFRLQDVTKAPLAQRRKLKKSSNEARSSSSDSAHSHGSLTPTKSLTSSARSSPSRNLSNNSQASNASTGFVPAKSTNLENSGYFSFKESRIAALLPSLTPIKDSEDSSSGVTIDSSVHGVKRKLEIPYEPEEEDDDDDCIIISEEAPPSDVLNNNNCAKRPRMDTIVIE